MKNDSSSVILVSGFSADTHPYLREYRQDVAFKHKENNFFTDNMYVTKPRLPNMLIGHYCPIILSEVEEYFAAKDAESKLAKLAVIFKIFRSVINCKTIGEYISVQSTNPYLSHHGTEFLTDTLNYVLTGSIRKYNPTMMSEFVIANDTDKFSRTELSNTAEMLIKEDISMVDFIHTWTCRDGGINDFLYSVMIILGSGPNSVY